MSDYANKAQIRVCRLVEVLAGHEFSGLALTDIADAMKTPVPTVLRDLRSLEEAGWTRQVKNRGWVLTPQAVHPSRKVWEGYQRLNAQARRLSDDYLGEN